MLNRYLLTVLFSLFSVSALCAYDDYLLPGGIQIHVGAKIATTGPGFEVGVPITSQVNVRMGANNLAIDLVEVDIEGIQYDLDLDLNTYTFLVDYHPLNNSFRVTAGVVRNTSIISMEGELQRSVSIGGTRYSANQVGRLSVETGYDNWDPYLGMGFDMSWGKRNAWGFICDLGMIASGAPRSTITTSGTLSTDAQFLSDLETEKNEIEGYYEDYLPVYPLISIGLGYRF